MFQFQLSSLDVAPGMEGGWLVSQPDIITDWVSKRDDGVAIPEEGCLIVLLFVLINLIEL